MFPDSSDESPKPEQIELKIRLLSVMLKSVRAAAFKGGHMTVTFETKVKNMPKDSFMLNSSLE